VSEHRSMTGCCRLLGALALLVALTPAGLSQEKYAVLVSAGEVDEIASAYDPTDMSLAYWYDLVHVYRLLTALGFSDENIIALYGKDGKDCKSTLDQSYNLIDKEITDFPATAAEIKRVFARLGDGNDASAANPIPQVKAGDLVFFWWLGHGRMMGATYEAKLENEAVETWWQEGPESDHDFSSLFGHLPGCASKVLVFSSCNSAYTMLTTQLSGNHVVLHTVNGVIMTRTQPDEPGGETTVHNWINWFLGRAVKGIGDAPAVISMHAINLFVEQGLENEPLANAKSHIVDGGGIAKLIIPGATLPLEAVPSPGLHIRGYEEDPGYEPWPWPLAAGTSLGPEPDWWESPDVWVRRSADGLPDHESPLAGAQNHVYARVHNLGAETLVGVEAIAFAYRPGGTWTAAVSGPSWEEIGRKTLEDLPCGASRIVSIPWTIPSEDVGHQCLVVGLDHMTDVLTLATHPKNDNDKAQINVQVASVAADEACPRRLFFLENHSKAATAIDLEVQKRGGPPIWPGLELWVPDDLHLNEARVLGGTIAVRPPWRILRISSRATRGVIRELGLGPGEKRVAVLKITAPPGMPVGGRAAVAVTERCGGEKVGGVVFRLRVRPEAEVLGAVLDDLGRSGAALGAPFRSDFADSCAAGANAWRRGDIDTAWKIARKPWTSANAWEKGDPLREAVRRSRAAADSGDLRAFLRAQRDASFLIRARLILLNQK
jgi:hypothetical protein